MNLFKGASRGSYYWTNNAQTTGFNTTPILPTVPAVIHHIARGSHPSPYLSFTASFAVACNYAATGGRVYEIDTTLVPGTGFLEPVEFIVRNHQNLVSLLSSVNLLATHHDGEHDLILGLLMKDPLVMGKAPRRPGPNSSVGYGSGNAASFQGAFEAAVFAMRDAEILATAPVPPNAVTRVYTVP